MNNALFMLLAAGAGGCIALQASANSKFRQTLDSEPWATPIWASYLSICGTILSASLALLILRPPAPTWDSMRSTQWWNWIGGPLGTLIVLAGAYLTRSLGAAPFLCLMIAGQLVFGVVLDHYGLLGLAQTRVTVGRVVGVLLVVAGVISIKYL
jgi:transporter family-2 protein